MTWFWQTDGLALQIANELANSLNNEPDEWYSASGGLRRRDGAKITTGRSVEVALRGDAAFVYGRAKRIVLRAVDAWWDRDRKQTLERMMREVCSKDEKRYDQEREEEAARKRARYVETLDEQERCLVFHCICGEEKRACFPISDQIERRYELELECASCKRGFSICWLSGPHGNRMGAAQWGGRMTGGEMSDADECSKDKKRYDQERENGGAP